MKGDWKYAPLGWLVKGMSRLPLGALYVLSDTVAALLYHVVRYRRRVVASNFEKCFPEMDDKERQRNIRRFYRRFTEVMVESIKQLHIRPAEMHSRMEFVNTELLDSYLSQGKSVVAYFSHCCNWEWATSVPLHLKTATTTGIDSPHVAGQAVMGQVYRPLRNKWFDRLMLQTRQRWNTICFPKATVFRTLLKCIRNGHPTLTGFMSDQKPSHGDPTLVVEFLNRPTAMITGTETLGRRLGMAAVYWDIERKSRGHYRITVRPVSDDMAAEAEGECTLRYAAMLQDTIRRDPPCWLWSHNRWKNPIPADAKVLTLKPSHP